MGGAAALLSALLIPIQVLVFLLWPPPSTVLEWFKLLQDNPLAGLADLDLLLVIDNLLLVPLFAAFYLLLRRVSDPVMLVATGLGLIGVAMFIASNPAFEMLSLSQRYTASSTEGEQAIFVAAGEAMLATWVGTAFQVAYFIGSAVGIILGIMMLRSRVFSKTTAYMGILGNAVALGYYVPVIGIYLSVFSVLFLEIWYILVAFRLFQLGQTASPATMVRA